MNGFQPDYNKLQTIQQIVEASLNCQRQNEVLQLLDVVYHYEDYALYLQYLLLNTTNEVYLTIILSLLRQAIKDGRTVDYIETIQIIFKLIRDEKQYIMKGGCSILTLCFCKSPLTSQMIIQFIGSSLQSTQTFLVQFGIELLDTIITDHFENLDKSFYPTIEKLMEMVLQYFSSIPINLKSKVLNTFTELILFEAPFLSNALELLMRTFCTEIYDDKKYRINLCSFLVSIPQIYIEEIPHYMKQIQTVVQILLNDKCESVFIECTEVIISLSSEFAEETLPFLIQFIPLFFERCLLTEELIYKINEEDQTRQKEQVMIHDDEQYDYDTSVRSSVFNLFELINNSFDSNTVGTYINAWCHCYEQRQQVQNDWRNIEVLIRILNVSVPCYHENDLFDRFGRFCIIPIQNIMNENTYIKRIAIEFIGNVPTLVVGTSPEIKNSLYNYLLKLIGDNNYTISCISLQTLTNLINGGLFKDKLNQLFSLIVPTIKNLKGQPLLNVCDLLSSVIETLGTNLTNEMENSIQNELIQCIYLNNRNEDVIDICLTTLFSNIMLFHSISNDMINTLITISFQCITTFIESADIVSSCLRVFECLYKKSTSYMISFINSHQNEMFKIFEVTLPQLHKIIIQDSYGLLGDIMSGCSSFIIQHLNFFMENINTMISTFHDDSVTSVIWAMIQALAYLPQNITPYIHSFAKKSFHLFTDSSEAVIKNMYVFVSKTIPIDQTLYIPYLQLLTSQTFKTILLIKQPLYIIETLTNFGHLIIKNIVVCKCNNQIIKDVYFKASQMIPSLVEIAHKVIATLEIY
ncbi:hypothetical protein KM1_053230 [Entamoeba histolytica HM-3:IMSS]|uniref:Uncharacterized protein n=3 Tax=Entamoeba histolytica TaxID=5759 RepID=C4M2Z4_ENTH1|nr:hypothetical protein EHI_074050 [Entamoeba histolytica HM-1:IMSS]EAL48179.2 hypothetical protein EHI_074050 [Entamoeba histolytica HM-1:IMSS]EMD48114.1 Hypothetical protein EHI5A_039440 [Entamoeba histolytica KU27]EMS14165.1 hypothetical protein KM1_053230 [Entamoeba histolytica HM-3:IMSS]|eukprot:XP_653566.2 hypothetical protein EHI_074050 [Entamoeba histolytica HM-1:IMSS]